MGKFFFFVVLIIFLLMIWKYYWKIQLMYNSGGVSLWGSFRNPQIKKGLSHAKNKKIVIAGLLRDVARRIPEIKKKTKALANLFQDYRILIVENDSQDSTRELLLEWAREDPKVIILGCGRNVKTCSLNKGRSKTRGHSVYRSRIEKMAFLRNIYLSEVTSNFSDFDYLAVWDLDIVGTVYLDGVAHSLSVLEEEPDTSAICAYGIYTWGPFKLYYDTYATLESGDNFHIQNKLIHDLRKGLSFQYSRGDPPKEVISCFSGFTIYKIPEVIKSKYGTTPPEDPSKNLECEHVFLHRRLPGKIKMNPNMVHLVVLNE